MALRLNTVVMVGGTISIMIYHGLSYAILALLGTVLPMFARNNCEK